MHMESGDISWGEGKDEILRLKFGFGFQRIVDAIENDDVLDIRDHPNLIDYGHQKQMIVKIDGYAWVVPYILDTNGIFLKTMFPSRTETKRYIGGKQ